MKSRRERAGFLQLWALCYVPSHLMLSVSSSALSLLLLRPTVDTVSLSIVSGSAALLGASAVAWFLPNRLTRSGRLIAAAAGFFTLWLFVGPIIEWTSRFLSTAMTAQLGVLVSLMAMVAALKARRWQVAAGVTVALSLAVCAGVATFSGGGNAGYYLDMVSATSMRALVLSIPYAVLSRVFAHDCR